MSKRLSDTEIWKKSWFYDLDPKLKLFWFYILSDCDAAGVWSVNLKLAENILGFKFDIPKLLESFKDQIAILHDGKYWFIIDFIHFQYGYPISEKSPMRKKINDLLSLRGLDIDTYYEKINTVSIGYKEFLNTLKDKEKDKDIKGVKGEKVEKKKQPPITKEDLTDDLLNLKPNVYRLAKMLIDNCPDVMAMDHPMSLLQLEGLINKYGSDPVEKILKSMQNKGIGYLRKKDCHYAFLTVESWIK